jgi:hypothetical protein
MIALESNQKKDIEDIISHIQCRKGFSCYRSGFADLCQARDIGLESFVECLEEDPRACPFVIPFASKHLCRCRLRIYIAKQLGR